MEKSQFIWDPNTMHWAKNNGVKLQRQPCQQLGHDKSDDYHNHIDENYAQNYNEQQAAIERRDAMLIQTLKAAGIDVSQFCEDQYGDCNNSQEIYGTLNNTPRAEKYNMFNNDMVFKYKKTNRPKVNSYLDAVCMVYFIFISFTTMLLAQFFIMPLVYEDAPQILRYRTWFTWFVFYQVLANYALVYIYSSPYEPASQFFAQPGLPQCDWSVCKDCEQPTPPRTHHCPFCRKCVLKRDHHCFFTGSCIGFYNQRHFIIMCFYCTVGAFYGFYLMWQLFCMEYYYPLSADIWHFVLPATIIEWIVGRSTLLFVFLVTIFYLTVMSGLGSLAMFVWQMYLVICGLTTHECAKGIKTYRGAPLREKLHCVFGPWFLIQFIMPMPFISIRGDGIEWTHVAKKI